jgi:pimeloyl-ACP methyl ester carboxylesterase
MKAPRQIATNGVTLSVVEEGAGPLVVLCHGFPDLAYTWRHQVPALAGAGYRVVAPDMRGYGASSRPDAVEAYDAATVAADLIGLLDAFDARDAMFVGHDWGASIVWHLALAHPDRVRAVVGMSVPFAPRAPVPPISILRRRLGDDFYMVWFQEPGPADEALRRDVRRTLTTQEIWTADWASEGEPPERPAWLSEEDLDVYVRAFERTGFSGGLNYYRNIDRNWEQSAALDGRRVEQPSMFLTGSEDSVRKFMPARGLDRWLTDLRATIVLPGAGHWIQQERWQEVNEALLWFLGDIETGEGP